MITEWANKISDYLVNSGEDSDKRETFRYGAECLMNALISQALLLLVGIFTHHVLDLMIWSVCFMLLRVNMGGLHAPSHVWCILIGTAIGASSIVLSPLWVRHPHAAVLCVVLAAIVAVIIAPVPHQNKRYVQKNRRAIKRKVAVTLIVECLIALILFSIYPVRSAYIVSAITMVTVLGMAGMVLNPR